MSRSAFTVSRTVSLSPACKAVFRETCLPSSQYSRTIETPLPFAGSTLSISSRYCAYTAPQPIPVPDFETTTRSTRVSVPVSVFRVYPKASSGVRTSILPATASSFHSPVTAYRSHSRKHTPHLLLQYRFPIPEPASV